MADLIDRQAAIKAIENLQSCYNGFSDTYDKACIIGVIEEIPTAQVNTPTDTPTDTISRQAAIDILMKEWKAYKDYPYVSHVRHGLEIAIAILENKVPSAQRTGRWIPVAGRMGKEVQCDCCGEVFWYWLTNFTYCPNCGADMRGEQDG